MSEKDSTYSKKYVAGATTDFISKNVKRIDVDKSKLTIGKDFDKIIIIFKKAKKKWVKLIE